MGWDELVRDLKEFEVDINITQAICRFRTEAREAKPQMIFYEIMSLEEFTERLREENG